MELENLFQRYWIPGSAHEYFPFLVEEACRSAFQVFISAHQGPSIAIENRSDVSAIIKGMVLAIAALSGLFCDFKSPDIYFLFAERTIERVMRQPTFDYIYLNTLLVRYSLYVDILNKLGLFCIS